MEIEIKAGQIVLKPETAAERCQLNALHEELKRTNVRHTPEFQWQLLSVGLPIVHNHHHG